ncbi:hypothetical protein HZU77_010415 [Neisseriaceae bacterium TC5R-5]|nr:hypothetical protein [Neisseriaceae bacterium TC5R-5]
MKNKIDLIESDDAATLTLKMFLKEKNLEALLDEVSEAVKKQPNNAEQRWLLFQILCVNGAWERALKQLAAWGKLESAGVAKAQMYRNLIESELFRVEVFAGKRQAGFIEPLPEWAVCLQNANSLFSEGNLQEADRLRIKALDMAPISEGQGSNIGQFTWLSDSDTRLGPICEMIVAGGYRWLPFEIIEKISIAPISSLVDMVWCPAVVVTHDHTVLKGYIPSRYPGSELAEEKFKLGYETSWQDVGETTIIGVGQKTWSTDAKDYGVLEIGEIQFGQEILNNDEE